MREFGPNSLYYVSLNGYSNDCWLKTGGINLRTLQDIQMINDFDNSKKGDI